MTEKRTSGSIQPAEYSMRTPLYHVIGDGSFVLRRPHTPQELLEPSKENSKMTVTERDAKFAGLLLDLQEKYGIRSPQMSLYQDGPAVFIRGQWVEGKNLSDQASEIPVLVLRHAASSIIDYYTEACRQGSDYLTDLRPSNIIYGRIKGDTDDHLYFIDLEPRWAKAKAGKPLPIQNEFQLVEPELMFLLHEGKTRGDSWDDLEQAFKLLQDSQK